MTKRGQKIERLCLQQAWKCAYCQRDMVRQIGRPDTATVDHIEPTSKGGLRKEFNEVAACSDCNSRKGNMDPADWIKKNAQRLGDWYAEPTLFDEVA